MMKKGISMLLALCFILLLTGCSRTTGEEEQTPAATLPPAEARYSAPDGDGILASGREYRMYFPGRDGLHLVSRSVRLDAANLNESSSTGMLYTSGSVSEARGLIMLPSPLFCIYTQAG